MNLLMSQKNKTRFSSQTQEAINFNMNSSDSETDESKLYKLNLLFSFMMTYLKLICVGTNEV